ncbi:WAT1-related protein [Gossypium australe]|uniref:WAT1-related protein n=1 Tax=Gossypium australe TaxID=47621 RepID=A0A5B6VAD3_9ROSI|nr:WAT1-related protein [Gossypium australe]
MGNLVPFVGMVMVTLAQVSSMVITKAAMSSGVDKYVLIVYSNALSSLILLPCSFILQIGTSSMELLQPLYIDLSPFLDWMYRPTMWIRRYRVQFSCNGYSHAQPCSSIYLHTCHRLQVPFYAFSVPEIKIAMMEKHEWRSTSGQAKVLGTTISIAGAFVVTFYKGPTILRLTHQLLSSAQINWVLGGLLLAVEAFINSAWYVIQTMVLKKFPAVLTVMFYLCFFNAILSAIYSLFLVKDLSAWKLRPNIGLVAILYSAIVATTFRISLCSWCLWKVGPLYVSMFKPLAIIFAAVMGIVFLGDDLSLGRVIGAIIIVSGFYGVLWGKAKEESGEESLRSPLLQNRTEDKRSFA